VSPKRLTYPQACRRGSNCLPGPLGTGTRIPRSADEMSEEALARYFVDREMVERTLSRLATDPRVAEVHSEMAERYEALALVFGGKRTDDPPIYS